MRDSAGVQLVHNPDPVIDTTGVTLTERLRIGVMDGPEHEQFFGIRGIAVSPEPVLNPSYWDVFSAAGEFQHTVRLPVRFSPRAIHSSVVYGVQRDENDVEYVVVFEVKRRN